MLIERILRFRLPSGIPSVFVPLRVHSQLINFSSDSSFWLGQFYRSIASSTGIRVSLNNHAHSKLRSRDLAISRSGKIVSRYAPIVRKTMDRFCPLARRGSLQSILVSIVNKWKQP
jgi:hypothetical protein